MYGYFAVSDTAPAPNPTTLHPGHNKGTNR